MIKTPTYEIAIRLIDTNDKVVLIVPPLTYEIDATTAGGIVTASALSGEAIGHIAFQSLLQGLIDARVENKALRRELAMAYFRNTSGEVEDA